MSATDSFVDLHGLAPRPDPRQVFWADLAGDYGFLASVNRAETALVDPIEAVWCRSRRQPGAMIGTTFGSLLIVRSDVADTLERERVTGWVRYPIVIVGKDGEVFTNYTGIAVSGRHGPFDLSGLALLRVDNGVKTYTGARFRREEWDGSDLSVRDAPGFLGVYATPRAATLMSELCGQEVRIRPVADIPFTDVDLKYTT